MKLLKILLFYLQLAYLVSLVIKYGKLNQLKENLESFAKICSGAKNGGPIAQLEADEKFRWITAVKSSSIQSSRPHPGLSTDLDATFDKLYTELVL